MGSNLRMRPLTLPILAALLLAAQSSGSVAVKTDAYAVYDAVIPSDWLIQQAHTTELLIQATTAVDDPLFKRCVPAGPGLTAPWQDSLNDFKAQMAAAKDLKSQFSLPVPYRLESRDTIREIFTTAGNRGWYAFHATYPRAKGYLRLSAVGFDKAHEHALVYMDHSCGAECAGGQYHFLERAANGWREVPLNVSLCEWIS
ncbi:MAG: hypothetical protein ACRD1V_12995 [Vicinamibacterales bacterium]